MTVTIDESREGALRFGTWSTTFPDPRFSDRGSLQVPVDGQQPGSVVILLSSSRSCQGVFGPTQPSLAVSASVVGDHMAGTYVEFGCIGGVIEGTLDLRRR